MPAPGQALVSVMTVMTMVTVVSVMTVMTVVSVMTVVTVVSVMTASARSLSEPSTVDKLHDRKTVTFSSGDNGQFR